MGNVESPATGEDRPPPAEQDRAIAMPGSAHSCAVLRPAADTALI